MRDIVEWPFHFFLGAVSFIPHTPFAGPVYLPGFYNMLEHNVLQNSAFVKDTKVRVDYFALCACPYASSFIIDVNKWFFMAKILMPSEILLNNQSTGLGCLYVKFQGMKDLSLGWYFLHAHFDELI